MIKAARCRSPRRVPLLFTGVLLAALPLVAQEGALPRVRIITTGGTIAGGRAGGGLTGEDFLEAVPELATVADLTAEEFSRVGSSKMTPSHWLGLSRRINQLFREDSTLTGIVVTHGTDSLEETAFFLHLTVRDPRPVVLVGAMRNWSRLSPDGPANLMGAVRVAVSPDAVGKGGLILMNDEISSARDAIKTDALRVHTFRALNRGFLGVADADTVLFYRELLSRHTATSEFDTAGLDVLPEVPMVTDFTGNDGNVLRRWAEQGVDAIVVIGFPTGLLSAGMTEAAEDLVAQGMPIVISSRAPVGRVSDDYRIGENEDSRRPIAGRDLPAHKARILLMLTLTRTRDLDEIQRIFDTY